jgi:hypothetical protein
MLKNAFFPNFHSIPTLVKRAGLYSAVIPFRQSTLSLKERKGLDKMFTSFRPNALSLGEGDGLSNRSIPAIYPLPQGERGMGQDAHFVSAQRPLSRRERDWTTRSTPFPSTPLS